MGPTERIERAIDRITNDGWVQGISMKDGGFCIYGGLEYEQPGVHHYDPSVTEACQLVLEALGYTDTDNAVTRVCLWNDRGGRQLHEVIGALALAAELSRKREFTEELVPA